MTENFLSEIFWFLGVDFSLKVVPPENLQFSGGRFWRRYRPFSKISFEIFENFRARKIFPDGAEKSRFSISKIFNFEIEKSRFSIFDYKVQPPKSRKSRFWTSQPAQKWPQKDKTRPGAASGLYWNFSKFQNFENLQNFQNFENFIKFWNFKFQKFEI